MNSMDKFNQFIDFCLCYHLNRCENGLKCCNCDFILNLWYLYVENRVGGDSVKPLQDFCYLYDKCILPRTFFFIINYLICFFSI